MNRTAKAAMRYRRMEQDAEIGRMLRSMRDGSGIMRSGGLWLAHKTFGGELTPFESLQDALEFVCPKIMKSGGLF